MNYQTFMEEVKGQVQEVLGKDYEVQITANCKLNGAKKLGLSISKKEEEEQVVPVVYLEEFFERYQQGESIAECVQEICKGYNRQKEKEKAIMKELETMGNLRDWEKVKENVYPVLVLEKENEEWKKEYCYRKYLDFMVLYVIRITEGKGNVKITKEMERLWGICENEIYEQALINMKKDGYQVRSLISMITEMLPEAEEEIGDSSMYVLTNKERYFGSAGIFLCAEMFQEVVGKKNFYIIPSSIHELILIVDNEAYKREALSAMVREVNERQLSADERLSDHVYYFDWETKQIYC